MELVSGSCYQGEQLTTPETSQQTQAYIAGQQLDGQPTWELGLAGGLWADGQLIQELELAKVLPIQEVRLAEGKQADVWLTQEMVYPIDQQAGS